MSHHDLAAIAMHFNPAGYTAPRENFRRFREHFRGCPLFTLEVSFDGKFTLGCDWQIHATAANLIWQKEPLINWMVARLPQAFTKVAWIDADLLFLNPDWAQQAAELLDRVPTCQLYSGIHYADQDGKIGQAFPSSVRSILDGQGAGPGTCGGAWAARRELLTQHGMYAHSVVGGGDSCWLDAVQGIFDGKVTRRQTERQNQHFRAWGERLYADVGGRLGCVPGDIIHLYHGTFANRRYGDRYRMLVEHEFDPDRDVKIGWNGLLEWSTAKPELHRQMAEYFSNRAEDDPDRSTVPTTMTTPPARAGELRTPARATTAANAVIGCYFVTAPDPQRKVHHPGDSPELVRGWAESLRDIGVPGVLLVDHATPQLQTAFPWLELIRVPAVPLDTHTNAWRWNQLGQYLSRQPRPYVVATDVFDVTFRQFTWPLFEQSAKQLWIGTEEATIGSTDPASAWLLNRIQKTVGVVPEKLHGRPLLNAGIVGGRGSAVQQLAGQMWSLLCDKGSAGESASDMAALNVIVHTQWPANKVWCDGAPLHSRFRGFEVDRQDVCIIHK